jgi:hypothetical protein
MKQFLITLMAFAGLIIATQAQQGAVTGTPESLGVSMTVFQPPALTIAGREQVFTAMIAERVAAIEDMEFPAIRRVNGRVLRKLTTKDYNHDGLAFVGLNAKLDADVAAHYATVAAGYIRNRVYPNEVANEESELAYNRSEYQRNINSGKWHKFQNGD